MTDLAALIERVERAGGPDREMDALIQRAFGSGSADYWFADRAGNWVKDSLAPAYTASIDAAMTLAKDFGGQITFFKDGTAKAFLWQPYPLAVEVRAATPALALVAAALRSIHNENARPGGPEQASSEIAGQSQPLSRRKERPKQQSYGPEKPRSIQKEGKNDG